MPFPDVPEVPPPGSASLTFHDPTGVFGPICRTARIRDPETTVVEPLLTLMAPIASGFSRDSVVFHTRPVAAISTGTSRMGPPGAVTPISEGVHEIAVIAGGTIVNAFARVAERPPLAAECV